MTATRTLAPHGTQTAYARHIQRGETACRACKAANRDASRASRAVVVEQRRVARSRAIARDVALRGVRPFQIPRCANAGCRAPLADSAGEPRWDLLEGRFVCLRGCKAAAS